MALKLQSFERLTLLASALVPASMTVWWAPDVAPAEADATTIAALGFAYTGASHILDPLRGALARLLPVSTHAYRLTLINALILGLFSALLCDAIRRFLARFDARATRLSCGVALFATLAVTISPAWQSEAASVSGTLLATVLVLAPICFDPDERVGRRAMLLALALALAADPAAGVLGIALVLSSRPHRDALPKGRTILISLALLGALVVLAAMSVRSTLVRAEPLYPLVPFREYGSRLRAAVVNDWGPATVAIGVLGLVVGYLQGARDLVRCAGIVIVGAPVLFFLGSKTAVPLLSCALAIGLATLAHVVLLRVRYANLAFARTSSGLIFVMLLAWPIALADTTSLRLAVRIDPAQAKWDLLALGSMPTGALIVTDDAQFMRRLTAVRIARGIAPDATIIDPSAMASPVSRAALRLSRLSVWHDLYFDTHIGEFALAHDASLHPLYVTRSKRFTHPVMRHLMPDGLVFRVDVEPRAQSERRRALESSRAVRQTLVLSTENAKDAKLTALTATLLREQVVAAAAGGDREIVPALIEDLIRVQPDHDVVEALRRRLDSPSQVELD